ncbi:unnamed protein product [Lampetra fluviatilis]
MHCKSFVQNSLDMGRVVPSSWLLSGSTQLLLTVLMLATVARIANGCSISGLQVVETSATSITIKWTNNSYVNSYTFELYDNVQNASSNFSTDGSASNFTFTELVAGRSYRIHVTLGCFGFSNYYGEVNAHTIPPKVNVTVIVHNYTAMMATARVVDKSSFPPQVTVTVIVNSPTAMTVSWVAPISDVDYYVVYLSETYNATAVMSFNLDSNIITQAFTNLVPGRSYNASVTAYSGINSQPSDIVTSITYMSIRLAGNATACQGRVEVFYNGEWGTVCDDFWSAQDAKVVCRQLGCGLTGFAVSLAYFGLGSGPIWLDDVQCSGYETQLSDCSHHPWGTHNCGHYEDASVICLQVPNVVTDRTLPPKVNVTVIVHNSTAMTELSSTNIVTSITNMSIRLAGNTTACQGRVEVFYNGEWGTVCDDLWSPQDAKVVCRQLGCGLTGFAVSLARFGLGSGLIWLDDVQCSGYETQLSDCSHRPWGTHNCGHDEDASVICLQVPSFIMWSRTELCLQKSMSPSSSTTLQP